MNSGLNLNEIIQCEVARLSQKHGKDFFDCEDIVKITGLGRDTVRGLLRSTSFPTTKVGKRYVVSVVNFVRWSILQNCEVNNG